MPSEAKINRAVTGAASCHCEPSTYRRHHIWPKENKPEHHAEPNGAIPDMTEFFLVLECSRPSERNGLLTLSVQERITVVIII